MSPLPSALPPRVDILVSTFNAQPYLCELFDSILGQTYTNWRVLIRDDGSGDATLDVIKKYAATYPDKFRIVELSRTNIGYNSSFFRLLEKSDAQYIAFCDQDDVWMPEKLATQVTGITAIEQFSSGRHPVLVHSDLQVHDEKMHLISDSLWKYQYLAPDIMRDIRYLLVQNFVTGCTIMINRALKDLAVPVKGFVAMYDWWLALLALEQGTLYSINRPLVKYRQHGANTIGARKWGLLFFKQVFRKKAHLRSGLNNAVLQAGELLQFANANDRNIIYNFSRLKNKRWLQRKKLYPGCGVKKYGRLKQFAAWLFI